MPPPGAKVGVRARRACVQEAAFEASRQLAAQIEAAQRALAELQQLADMLDAEGRGRAEDTARCTAAVENNSGKAARYAAQQAARQQALDRAGFAPEASASMHVCRCNSGVEWRAWCRGGRAAFGAPVLYLPGPRPGSSCCSSAVPTPPALPMQLSQVHLQARGREHARITAEVEAVQKELQAFAGLPADPDAARAATTAKRAELERLRRQLREHLDGLAAA